MAHLPPTKPRNAGLFRPSGKVHIFKKLKNLGERRAAKCPRFKGVQRFFAFAEEMIEISTENVKRIVPELAARQKAPQRITGVEDCAWSS